jgi:hypothetical protein
MAKLYKVKSVFHFSLDIFNASPAKTESDVFKDTEVWEEGIVLEDSIDVTLIRLLRGDIRIADVDGALRGFLKTGNHAKRGRFATA